MPREKETGKRFCFELVSPYRLHTLQAESEQARDRHLAATWPPPGRHLAAT